MEKLKIREGKSDEMLTDTELKIFNKYIGKHNWLALNTRPDLSVYVVELERRHKLATLKDLRRINRILDKVREKRTR